MAIAFVDSSGNAYTGQLAQGNDPETGSANLINPGSVTSPGAWYNSTDGSTSGGMVHSYDTSAYSSPELAYLDMMNPQGQGAGLSAVVQQLGLDPKQVIQGIQAWQAQNPTNNITWLGSPAAILQSAAEGNPSLASVVQPYVAANQQQFNAGQAQTAKEWVDGHPAMEMHGTDYAQIAAGMASILGMGALGGAFAGVGAGAGAGTGGLSEALPAGFSTGGEAGLDAGIAGGTGGLSEPLNFAGSGLGGGAGGAGGTGGIVGDSLGGTAPGVAGDGTNAYESVINGLSNPTSATNPFEAQVGSSLGGQGATSATGPLANGIGGQLANGGLGSTVSGLANGGSIGGTTASGTNGLASAAQSYLTNPTNYLSTIGNFLNQQNLGSSLGGIANTAGSMSNQANNPEAQAAYGTFMDYVNNPQKYISNVGAPIVNGIVQGLPPSIAKSGNLSGSLAAAITAGNSALSQNYNGFLATLGSQTGLQQGTGNAGSVYGNLAGQGAVANASAYSGLGSLVAGLGKSLTSNNSSNNSQLGVNPFGTTYS